MLEQVRGRLHPLRAPSTLFASMMRQQLSPTLSVIVPSPPGVEPATALSGLSRLRYPADKVEVLVAYGTNPSEQRNQAAAEAQGELLHFLDDDSVVEPHLMRAVLDAYHDFPEVDVVGGPALTSPLDSSFQLAAGAAMGSAFGLGPARHRHTPRGLPRYASERDLILCNLNVKRATFAEAGGFDSRLYPNEENELLDRMRERGVRMVHHPLAVVFRSRRGSLAQVLRQHMNYGRGRMEQFFVRPTSIDAVYAAPLGFSLYLAAAMLFPSIWMLLPLVAYAGMAAAAALLSAVEIGRVSTMLWLLLIYPVMHVAYGLGMLWGLIRVVLRRRRRPSPEVTVVRHKRLGDDASPAGVAHG